MGKPNEPIVIQLVSQERKLRERLSTLASSYERELKRPCQLHHADQWGARPSDTAHLIIVDLDSMTDEVLRELPQFRQHNGRSRIVVTYQ